MNKSGSIAALDRSHCRGLYVMVFVTGIFALFVRSGVGYAAGLIAGVFYIAVTLLFILSSSL